MFNDFTHAATKIRCAWCNSTPLYQAYHDNEWGVPVHNDVTHFEFLLLEGAQAGLNWETILKKRAGYAQAFYGFDAAKVAAMADCELEALMHNPNIVRNRLKIWSARRNAQVFLAIQKEFGSFNTYVWGFVGGTPLIGHWQNQAQVPTTTAQSDALAKDLRKRGMSFVGSTIMYAYLQATGLVNDHIVGCWRYAANTPTK